MPDESNEPIRYHITLLKEEPEPEPVPEDIPWQWVATSRDMLDQRFCDQAFPPLWRSSLALYAHNPAPEDLPESLDGSRITYLKLTCSITGYQPSDAEVEEATTSFFHFPNEEAQSLSRLLETYWPCYGVLVNVAVFPSGHLDNEIPTSVLPHIIDFEPKSRDLYQTATDTGEILTASASSVNVGKSQTHTESTETGLSGGIKGGHTPGEKKGGWGGEADFRFSHKWGETDKDVHSVTTVASQERKEKHAAVTELKQMYNLLTGYHAGTNRAVFLMLPRPHTLQPTPARTFVQGLRVIEGMQDFFLIVSRPEGMERICVEVSLDTGHLPEDVTITPPPAEYEENEYSFTHGPIEVNWYRERNLLRTVPGLDADGWEFDRTKGDEGHPAIKQELYGGDNCETRGGKNRLRDYDYQVEDPGTAVITGKLTSHVRTRRFHRRFTVYRRRRIDLLGEEPTTEVGRLLVTRRSLCACYPPGHPPFERPQLPESWIAKESMIRLAPENLRQQALGQSGMPALRDLLSRIHRGMISASRPLGRRPPGEVGFLDTDWFKEQIRKLLPERHLEQALSRVEGLPEEVVRALGAKCAVHEALKLDLESFVRKTGLRTADAIQARRRLLGLPRGADGGGSVGPK